MLLTTAIVNLPMLDLTCPLPLQEHPTVLLAHGGGGRLMHQLIDQVFLSTFGGSLAVQHDAIVLDALAGQIAFTTDSYVVKPLIFPGGTIGDLAVNGTVNDLAMAGSRPLYLSAGFILEEGLPMTTLWQVVQSMQQAAQQAGVKIVTGDTKVVDRGKGDGIFINTAGIGLIDHDLLIHPASVQVGDAILVNGDLGRHGIAILSAREGLDFETSLESDTTPLNDVVLALLAAGIDIHMLRDLTRGGLSSALNEIATAASLTLGIVDSSIPISEDVQGACELLGLDPLYVANEGRFVAIIPSEQTDKAIEVMRDSGFHQACQIGTIKQQGQGIVTLTNAMKVERILDLLSGEQLPRIC